MDESDPKVTIVSRRTRPVSPWLQIDEIDVRMPGSERIETYHGVRHADAVCVLAMTAASLFLLVRQYRPVIDAWTWEPPAGAVDEGETPGEAGARELKEETGFRVGRMIALGATHEDPPPRTNRLFGFFAVVEATADRPETGMRSKLVSGEALRACGVRRSGRAKSGGARLARGNERGGSRLPRPRGAFQTALALRPKVLAKFIPTPCAQACCKKDCGHDLEALTAEERGKGRTLGLHRR